VPVREGRRIRFVIVGNHHQTDGEILEVMKPRMVLPLNAGIVEEMGMRVRDHYRSLGFIDVQVVLHQKEVPDENLRIYRLTVVEGPRVRVEHIGFEGNDEFSDKFLKKELVSFLYEEVPYDVVFSGLHFTTINDVLLSGGKGEVPGTESVTKPLAVWPPEWIFWREAYEEAVEHIEKLYISEGYLDAEVSPPAIHRDGDTMRVTLVIEEGVRTYVGEVRFDGNEALADEALAEVAMIAEGNPFSGLGVKDAESAILDAYAEEGYRFAQVETVVDFSEDSRSASVRYVIDEGPQVVVDEIVVRGNAQTSTSLIKDRIAFDVGDVFTQGRERKSLNRLHRLDIFRSVSMDMLEPSLPGARKTVVIEVVERKPQYLGLKGGASTADGVRGSMEYAYRNLFGYAVDFHFRIALNYRLFFVGVTQEFRDWYLAMNLLDQLERNISVGLTLPHVPTIGNYFTFETSFAHLRRNANIYGITTNSLTASVLTGTGKRLNVTIQSGLESSSINANTEITEDLMNLEGLAARDRRALRVPQTDDPATFIVTSGRINLDFRDNPFTPTRGFSLNGSVSWIVSARPVAFTWYEPVTVDGRRVPNAPYRTEHDLSYAHHETAYSNLLKLYLDVTGYIKLGTPKVVLMLHAGGGIIVPLPEHTHTFPDRFFYLGGARSLRGVPEEALCAEDVYDQKRQCFQGGELMVIYKAELRTMLRGNFGLAFFVDAGNLWRGWDGRYGTRGVDGWYKVFYDLRYTAGAGIRYITPVGPINLDVGFLLNRHDDIGEPIGSFHFSIGTF
jgi:outer membrane protein assembly factor BamA